MTEMTGVVVFRNPVNSANGSGAAQPDRPARTCSAEYLRARELAERAAAKRAQSAAARHVHQELAQHYAALVKLAG